MSGVGLGGFVMPQLAERLIEHVGWRGAYVSLGLLTFVIAFPAVALWIREPRHGEGEHGAVAAIAVLPGHTVPEAVSTTRFWMLVDRIFASYVATLFFLAPIAGFAFLASATGMLPAIGVVLMGMGLGTEIDLIAFLVTRYFGQRAFGQIYGCFFMIFGLGSSLGRFLAGLIFDLAGSYHPALIGAALALVAAVILVNRLGSYRYPVQREVAPDLVTAPAAS